LLQKPFWPLNKAELLTERRLGMKKSFDEKNTEIDFHVLIDFFQPGLGGLLTLESLNKIY
jgi:hypothetical protein